MNKNFIVLIIVGIIFIVLAGGAGVFYQIQKDAPLFESLFKKIEKSEAIVKNLSSKTILSIVAYGQVTSILGRDITLSYLGDSLKVSIQENAIVYSLAASSTQRKAEFKDIKKGDNLNITLKLMPDGRLEGSTVMILSPPVKTK